jgi:type IV pilus assembly protein PilC
MPYYSYQSVNEAGEITKHSGHFEDISALDRFITSREEWLYKATALPAFVVWLIKFTDQKVPPLDIAEFCNNMSLYLTGGISINAALTDMAESAKIPAFKRAMLDIQRALNDGMLLSEALQETDIFPKIITRMTRIGEESGSLDKVMADAGKHIERIQSIKSATIRALIYPCFILGAVTIALLFWIVIVLPGLVELFKNMGVALPMPTRILIWINEFLMDNWFAILLTVIAIPISFTLLRKLKGFRHFTDKLIWYSPVLGTIVKGSQIAFYFQYIALMITSGVLISDALKTTQKSLSNSFFKGKLDSIDENIRTGITLYDSYKETKIFDPMACRMVGIGEQTGSLEGQMEKLAKLYFEKVQILVDVIGKSLEPIILGFAGVIFCFFAMALLLPMYDLIGSVG